VCALRISGTWELGLKQRTTGRTATSRGNASLIAIFSNFFSIKIFPRKNGLDGLKMLVCYETFCFTYYSVLTHDYFRKKCLSSTVSLMVVAWRSGSALVSMNEVNLRRARLVLGSVTVSGFNSRCGTFVICYHMLPATQINSAWPSLRG